MDRRHCSKFFGSLGDFIDGESESQCCTEIEQHMEECENCKIVISTIRTTMEICHNHAAEDIPETVRLRVRRVIRERLLEERLIEDF